LATPAKSSPTSAPDTHAAATGAAPWQSATTRAALSTALQQHPIHVAMHSDALGTVQVEAALHHNGVGALLSADRSDTHTWLGQQLPALERTLAAKQVQVGSLQMQQQGAGAGGSQPQSGNGRPDSGPALPALPRPTAAAAAPSPLAAEAGAPPSVLRGRLNIRA